MPQTVSRLQGPPLVHSGESIRQPAAPAGLLGCDASNGVTPARTPARGVSVACHTPQWPGGKCVPMVVGRGLQPTHCRE